MKVLLIRLSPLFHAENKSTKFSSKWSDKFFFFQREGIKRHEISIDDKEQSPMLNNTTILHQLKRMIKKIKSQSTTKQREREKEKEKRRQRQRERQTETETEKYDE